MLMGICTGMVCGLQHAQSTQEQEELERPGAGEELEYEDAEYGSGQSVDGSGLNNFHALGFLCVPGGFLGTILA